jgi:hypothetical protein
MTTMRDLWIAPGAVIKRDQRDRRAISGYLVVFGDAQQPDLEGDYFDAATEFGAATTTPLWLNHTLPVQAARATIQIDEPIGEGELIVDEQGVIINALLDARYAYLAEIAELLGWSSGTAAHLVRRTPVGKAAHIDRWLLGIDASITPTPAEPRTMLVRPAKALVTAGRLLAAAGKVVIVR